MVISSRDAQEDGAVGIGNLQSIYKGKKVFLTGHTGFKGSWMLAWLHLLGAQVKGYALAPDTNPSLYHLLDGDSLCESVIADLCHRDMLEQSIIDFQPDFIFHLAAQPLVRLSYELPAETFQINAIGTVYLLEAVRKLKKQCTIILITTDKVYENKEWLYPYRETDRLGGYDPYSASKACAELIISSYVQSFFNPKEYHKHNKCIAVGRAGNVIGGGDWAKDRIIPDIIRALQANLPIQVRNPSAVRPWQHVLEPVGGYLLLGARLFNKPQQFSGAWNFGPLADDTKTVEALVKEAIEIWGEGIYDRPTQVGQPHEAGLLKLDISKAITELNWKPVFTSKIAIAQTIDWYKAYDSFPSTIREFTLNQIKSFSSYGS